MRYAVFVLAVLLASCAPDTCARCAPPAPPVTPPPGPIFPGPVTMQAPCDASLWSHVYAGKFASAHDRLKTIKECVTITGTIQQARKEKDGDWHIDLKLDQQFLSMLNAKNIADQHGDLVVEPVCENPVTQRDTLSQGVCNDFHQSLFSLTMVGKNVAVTGAYVTDMEHGWNEIHPVSRITVIPSK